MSEHYHEDELEERDDVVDAAAEREADDEDRRRAERNGEPWAKTSSGDAENL